MKRKLCLLALALGLFAGASAENTADAWYYNGYGRGGPVYNRYYGYGGGPYGNGYNYGYGNGYGSPYGFGISLF